MLILSMEKKRLKLYLGTLLPVFCCGYNTQAPLAQDFRGTAIAGLR